MHFPTADTYDLFIYKCQRFNYSIHVFLRQHSLFMPKILLN